MKDIAVLIVIKDAYYQTRFCIENLIEKTSIPMKLYFFNNNSKDVRIAEYLKDLCERYEKNLIAKFKKEPDYTEKDIADLCIAHKWEIIDSQETVLIQIANNTLLLNLMHTKKDLHTHVCLYPLNILVNKNWLDDLIASNEIVETSGVVSIRTGDEKTFLTPVLHRSMKTEDQLKNVWSTDNNTVEGILFFEQKHLDTIGKFDAVNQMTGFEQTEFVLRFSLTGLKNYYITKQTALKIDCEDDVLYPKKNAFSAVFFRQEIERMVIAKNFKK